MPVLRSGRIVKPFVRKKRKAKLAPLVARVRRLEKSREFKFIDTQLTESAQNATPIITQLTNVVQGVTDTTRLGNKITVTGLMLRYTVEDTITNKYRIMIVQDKQTNGVIYAAGDLLEDATSFDNLISPANRDNKKRFRVMYDRLHLISVNGVANGQGRKFVKLNLTVSYDGNAGDITDLTSSSLSLLTVAHTASVAHTIFVRVFYTDG